jgi:RimJ/RimL family protein N-acetyltransferase
MVNRFRLAPAAGSGQNLPMDSLDDLWPVFSLRIGCGPLELRPIRDDDIPDLVDLARRGIHQPQDMPFYLPWSTRPISELGHEMASYYWRTRADFAPQHWTLNLIALWDGEPVGSQGVSTEHYLVTRTGETGSWLGQVHHGRGIGTAMRRSICAFLFDHLDASEVTSSAFTDNPASARVSAKVGYRPNGRERRQRRPGELATFDRFRLVPENLTRGGAELDVAGVAALRQFIGLDQPGHAGAATPGAGADDTGVGGSAHLPGRP